MATGIIDGPNFGSAFRVWKEKSPGREGICLGVIGRSGEFDHVRRIDYG